MIRTSVSVSVQYDNIFAPFPGKDWKKALAWAAEAKVDAVELILSDPELLDLRDIAAALESASLPVSTISTGQAMGMENMFLCAGSRRVRGEARERLIQDIDTAISLGRPNVTIGLIRGKGGLLPRQTEMEFLERELLKLAEYAAQKNVCINLEPINRYECSLINSTQEGAELLERLGKPESMGILYDTFHSNIEDPNMTDAILNWGHMFSHVHIADSNRCLPGEGHIDFTAVRRALDQVGYDGFVSLEVLNKPSAEHIVSHMKAAMAPFKDSKTRQE